MEFVSFLEESLAATPGGGLAEHLGADFPFALSKKIKAYFMSKLELMSTTCMYRDPVALFSGRFSVFTVLIRLVKWVNYTVLCSSGRRV